MKDVRCQERGAARDRRDRALGPGNRGRGALRDRRQGSRLEDGHLRQPEPELARRDRRHHGDRPDRAAPRRRRQRQRRALQQDRRRAQTHDRARRRQGARDTPPRRRPRARPAGHARGIQHHCPLRRCGRRRRRVRDGRARRDRRSDRAERSGQDDPDRRDHRFREAGSRHRARERRVDRLLAGVQACAPRRQPLVPAARAVREQHRAREPDGRLRRVQLPAVRDRHRAAHQPAALLDGDRRGEGAGARAVPRRACQRPAVRPSPARRHRTRRRRGAVDPATRRARRRPQRPGDRRACDGDAATRAGMELRHPRDRARHVVRDERVRPDHRARLRSPDRHRDACGDPRQSGRRRRVPGRGRRRRRASRRGRAGAAETSGGTE